MDDAEKLSEENQAEDAAAPEQPAEVSGEVASDAVVDEATSDGSDLENEEGSGDSDDALAEDGAPAEDAVAEDESEPVARGPIEELTDDDDDIKMDWYILKVQNNRENTICDALRRRVAVAGLDDYFGEIMVPTEDVAEFKNGKKRVVKRKLYPGYIVAHMSINDDTWFLVRETPGIGDFTGSQGKPSPMLPHEVDRIVKASQPEEDGGEPVKTAIPFKLGDRVRIKEGTFENFEGDVEGIDEANGHVTVMINIFGRSTPVELEHWQIESV